MKLIPFFLSLLVIFSPETTFAQGIMAGVCEGTTCSACHIAVLANTLIDWLIGVILVLFAVLVVVAGFGLVTAQGNPAAVTDAKSKFTNAFIGLLIVLSAWIVVDTLMRALVGGSGEIKGFGPWSSIECGSQTVATTKPGNLGTFEQIEVIPDVIEVPPGTIVQGAGGTSAGETCDESSPGGPRHNCARRIVACDGRPQVNRINESRSEVVCVRNLTLSGSYSRCNTSSFESVSLFGRRVQVHRDFAPSLRAIDAEWRDRGGNSAYPVYAAGGYRGCTSGSRSFHDYGFAVDINPDTNPHCKARGQDSRWARICNGNSLVTDMPGWFVNMFTTRGWGWGGAWNSSKDAMHFSMGKGEGGSVPIPGR